MLMEITIKLIYNFFVKKKIRNYAECIWTAFQQESASKKKKKNLTINS